ncbi:hypothetical protein DFH11DRAFT_1617970 [Phellopilus nigrolimitatus]|nr:hypothetical protein DFH11DRAFT_1617970 [Phellopilus nigrolimitatus]
MALMASHNGVLFFPLFNPPVRACCILTRRERVGYMRRRLKIRSKPNIWPNERAGEICASNQYQLHKHHFQTENRLSSNPSVNALNCPRRTTCASSCFRLPPPQCSERVARFATGLFALLSLPLLSTRALYTSFTIFLTCTSLGETNCI